MPKKVKLSKEERRRLHLAEESKFLPDKERIHCTSCGLEFKWYELSPGDGRCNACHP